MYNRKRYETISKYGEKVELWEYPEQRKFRVFVSGNCILTTDEYWKAIDRYEYCGSIRENYIK